MNELFKRKTQLVLNNQSITDLDIEFNITFNDSSDPIINDVTVYNLTPETTATIGNGTGVILNAGYGNQTGNILVGKVSDYEKSNDGKDSKLKLYVSPDMSIALERTVSLSYEPNVLASQILKDLFSEIGLSFGLMRLTNDVTYPEGKILTGSAQSAILQMVKETNSYLFTRCNIVYVVDAVYELDTGYLLRTDTGLIGSPEPVDVDGQDGYQIKCLLNPMLTLGSVFRVESQYVSGIFRVVSGTHSSDFITTLNCVPASEVSRYVPPDDNPTQSADNTPKGQIWSFLIGKGFSKAATAGIMGNIELESGYDPDALNDSSGAYGLFQWLGDRKSLLYERAEIYGVAVNSIAFQMEYFYYELTEGGESSCFSTYTDLSGLDAFKSLTDPEQAAILFEAAFERSGGAALSERINYALAVYSWDGGATKDATTGGYFSADAFKCACGCGLDCTQSLKNKMEIVAGITGGVTITSGARCENQNAIDNGAPDSLHLTGEACDGYIPGGSVDELYNAARQAGLGTIRYYSSGFVHMQDWPRDTISD